MATRWTRLVGAGGGRHSSCVRSSSCASAALQWPTRWHRVFHELCCSGRPSSRSFSALHPLPATPAPTSTFPTPGLPCPPVTVVHYDLPAADFPPQHCLRTLDALPPLPPPMPSTALHPAPFLYQTLPPIPLPPPSTPHPVPLHPRALHAPSITLALSGGVDSSVSLFLLLQAGFNVRPLYMRTWDPLDETDGACSTSQDRADAEAVCRHLGVQLEEVDFVREYWVDVFEGMVDGYRRGLTPNPDVYCNRHIKFGRLLEWVREHGAQGELLATGHYARTQRVWAGADGLAETEARDVPYVGTDARQTLQSALTYLDSMRSHTSVAPLMSTFTSISTAGPLSGPSLSSAPTTASHPLLTTRLLTALDPRKDQTYFLSQVLPSALPSLLFPLGALHKSHTRQLAALAALPTSHKPDSMGICMIGPRSFPSFLSHYLHLTPGRYLTPAGHSLGPHRGQEVYTTGQRAKVGGQKGRWYVAEKRPGGDVVVVDDRLHPLLLHDEVTVGPVNWMEGEPHGVRDGLEVWARFRSTEALRRVVVRRAGGEGQYRVTCVDVPHHLISPGQVVVFYLGEYCLGGGPIVYPGPSYAQMGKRLQFTS